MKIRYQYEIEPFCEEIKKRIPENPSRGDIKKVMAFIIETLQKSNINTKDIKRAFNNAVTA